MFNLDTSNTGYRPEAQSLGVAQAVISQTQTQTATAPFNDAAREFLARDWTGPLPFSQPQHILVPFDFSDASVRLLHWIRSVADTTGARVWVLHVISPWQPHPQESQPATLTRLAQTIGPDAPRLTPRVVTGRPVEEIVRFARNHQAELIVMATNGGRGLKDLHASATAERVTRRAPCPVFTLPETVLKRPTQPATLLGGNQPILVPTDFSPESGVALRQAVGIAQEHQAKVYVLNFSDHERRSFLLTTRPDGYVCPSAQWRLQTWVDRQVGHIDAVQTLVCPGKPSIYRLLLEASLLQAGLIVFGPRGYAWTERLRFSSSTDSILRNAPCPVLSLRAAGW